jgi:signal transduction histidine kinase
VKLPSRLGWFGRRSLFGKYVITFVALVISILALSGATEMWFTYGDRKAELLHTQMEKADDAAQRVEQFMAEIERQINWATRASSMSLAQRRDDYALILQHTPALAQISELDPKGREILRMGRAGLTPDPQQDFSSSAAFLHANTSAAWFGPVVFSRHGPTMEIAMALAGKPPGVTVATVELKFLADILNGIQAGAGMYAYIVNARGNLIAHTDSSMLVHRPHLQHLPQVAALARAPEGAVSVGRSLDGQSVLAASAPIPSMQWWLFVEQPLADAYAPVTDLLGRLFIILLAALVLCIGAGLILARWMTVPIQAVRDGAAHLAEGNFSHKIEVRTGDEIEDLADDFNLMASQLQDSYAKLEQKVEERTRDLERSVSELRALEEVGLALAASLNLNEVLATIVVRSVEVTGAHGGAIYSFDPERRAFNLAEAYGLDPDFVAAIREVRIRRSHGLLSEVAERKIPIQIPHIAAARDFPLRGATLAAGFQSALIAPLIGSAELLGVLVIERREAGYFPDNTVALIKTLANQSVLAMSNAKLFEQVQEKNKQLAIANEHKSLFFANMSHELRTPLNAVLGYTELMQDGIYGDIPERAKQVLARVQTNGAHLLSLINDVLDISKIEAGELSLSLSDYSLRAVIETVVNATGSLAQAKGLRISTDIAADLPVGHGDERRLTQVLLNIVSNAIKFTDKGGVMIRAGASGGDFKMAVEDTGPGIAPEDQARIFEAFHQVDSTITKQKGGTGLGLSISKRFVEMHGGTISLTSALGEGSTFRVQIPVRVDRQMEAA